MVCTANDLLEWRDFPKGLKVLLLDEDSSSAAEIRSKLEEMNILVSSYNSNGRFTFLEVAKDLPTIMTSKIQCLTTMMKCIALGAVEFLLKPLSDDKLRNIWQHVVHRAFNAEGNELSESLKPVKESMVSLLHFQLENGEQKSSISEETEHETAVEENGQGQSEESDEYQAPPTPQLKTRGKPASDIGGAVIKEEDESPDGCKIGSNNMPLRSENKDGTNESAGDVRSPVKASGIHSSCGHKSNRKKMKVDWTPELHKKFVRAVEQLGVDQAIPSRILELMKVEGLTRHNVASHLQKYRMQRRHILPKEDVKRAPHPRDLSQRNYYPHKHVMAFPPYPSNPILPSGQMHADAWGCPVMPPPPHVPCPGFPQNAAGFHSANTTHGSYCMPQNSFDLHHPEEEVIDKVVNEAISKPWLPLPLGLKPPSIDSVLTELSKQGISTIPPH
ncbi:CheY-like two-component responsive regulator family protein [Actinidia rufa]|uniref:CheY-like two-component responsive regulator family protein n=1 Tax=Actinidia rufa TaxID=165716 RepID=A0A7J0H1E1_9ERIC|nr:CheY-like two-component responsive regulator family protein [Actinidia rufa]